MKKNIIEIEFSDFIWLLVYLLGITAIIFFLVGSMVGSSGEFNKGYLTGYKQCMKEFNITKD